jgi:hypothetical protein
MGYPFEVSDESTHSLLVDGNSSIDINYFTMLPGKIWLSGTDTANTVARIYRRSKRAKGREAKIE